MISPDDPAWLRALIDRSILVPARQRPHWRRVISHLSAAQRYELAATLLEFERWLEQH
jgi:hypothetical protein